MPAKKTPLIVGHRGSSRAAPENTLPSFELAWKQGADAIEGDFRLTSDEHIVCMHDEHTARTAGARLNVAKSSLAELQELDVGSWHSQEHAGARIPTLEEVLSTVSGRKQLYIEVKCGEEIVDPLITTLAHSRIDSRQITVISFDSKVIHELKAATQVYKAMLLVHFKKDLTGGTRPKLKAVLSRLEDIRADGLSTHTDCITEDFVHEVMDAGYEHHVWTVDDLEKAKLFASWGTRSITSNVPGEIRNGLRL